MMTLATAAKLDARINEIRTARRMKEIFGAVMDAADDTGYSYDFLCGVHEKALADGEDFRESLIDVITIAYEQDF